jgi:TonB family protein
MQRIRGADDLQKAERMMEILDSIIADEGRSDFDRAIAYQIRGEKCLVTSKNRDHCVSDFHSALALMPRDASRYDDLVQGAFKQFTAASLYEEAYQLAEEYPDDFSFAGSADLYKAEFHAAQGELDRALEIIGTTNEDGDSSLEKRLRYVLLLTEGRYQEAHQVLATFETDAFFAEIIQDEQSWLLAAEERGASRDERRERGLAFNSASDQIFSDSQPQRRTNPRNFNRCILPSRYPQRELPREVRVRIGIDIAADGSVSDVQVLESDDPCFDPYVIDAVERWRYQPATINGEPTERIGVGAAVVFRIGD